MCPAVTRKALDLVTGSRALELEATLPNGGAATPAETLSLSDFKRARQRALESEDAAEQPLPALGIPAGVQFHVLSFEGPDPYARIGGLETRVAGICEALTSAGHDTHLWFVGDPGAPGNESRGRLHLHRWCQWLSEHHHNGVYDGQEFKVPDYARSLPPLLLNDHLREHLRRGGYAVVMAEEWQTADAVLHLDYLLRSEGLRKRVRMLWNANNVFGFERIDWPRLRAAAEITTVSRYMKQVMKAEGIDTVAIPNGLSSDAYLPADRSAVALLHRAFAGRTALVKMARWDPDKSWLRTVEIVARLRSQGARPLLVARGGLEAHGWEVMERARAHGLRVADRSAQPGAAGLLQVLEDVDGVDVVNLRSHVDAEARRLLFQGAALVLANSGHEPFGLVGLEAMAAGGIACTGISGEDYAVPGQNAIVLQTPSTTEAVAKIERVIARPDEARALRKEGIATARKYAWNTVIQRNLLPQIELGA
jgi:glycosyltransferase involved in cell wall biosynthesis